jgi:large subunit ribosomal protein L25
MTTASASPTIAGHETFTLEATKRERVGSRYAKRVREQGGLPAVLYGHGQEPLALTLTAHTAVRHILEGEKVFNLSLDGQTETALLKDIQYDHLGRNVIHIDLERVDLDERVTTNLSLRLKGDAVGLKTAGAILVTQTLELEVECRVSDILEHFDVDISGLNVGDVLHAGDIKLPAGFELSEDPETLVAMIKISSVSEEPESAEAGEAAGGAAEPEVVGRKKEEGDESSAKD